MKKLFTFILLTLSLSASKADYWTQKADFPGLNRDLCFSFSMGTRGYIGCGRDTNLQLINTFWEYNQLTNAWTQKADFAGSSRYQATGFAILNKGYACFGDDTNGVYQNDVWQYDPVGNNWIQKTNFPGTGRVQAVSFMIQDKAYISCGLATGPLYFNDLWQYDPVADTWTQKYSFPGVPRISPIVFAYNGKGYIGAGYYYNGITNYPLDFWEYDPINNGWMQKANFAGPGRCQVANFALLNKGYGGTGESTVYFNDFWQYNFVSNQWTQKTNVPGPARDECISFSIGNKGYAGLGEATANYPNDFWEYTPDSSTGIDEFEVSGFKFQISPNPAKEFIVISYLLSGKKNINITITDVNGRIVETDNYPSLQLREIKINLHRFSKGMYLVELNNGKEKAMKKFIKE